MAVSAEFVEYIVDQLSDWETVTSKRMFGGVGLFCGGRMFGLIADDIAYLKVDDSNRAQFVEAGSSPFKPFAQLPTVLPYYEIPLDILEDTAELMEWASQSLAIQKT